MDLSTSSFIPSNIPGVFRDIAPESLYMGISACGSVKRYYNYCLRDMKNRVSEIRASLGDQGGLHVSSPFPDNSHEVIEGAVTKTGRKGLNIVNDLIAAGLTTPLPDWWAIPSLRRGNIGGNAGRAHRTMIPDSRGERFVLQRGGTSWPIFCTWADFSFDARTLAIGSRMGTPLDVSHTEQATYLVNQAAEDQAWHGLTDEQGSIMTIDGMSAPGLLDTTTIFDYSSWNGLTGAQIYDIVADAIQQLRITHPGPYTLYYPGNFDKKMNSPYTTAYPSGTIRAELEKFGPYGGRNLQVRLSDTLDDNRVVLIQMDSDSVDLVVGQYPVPLSWQDGPKWNTYWVVLSCVIFRMFPNANGLYGVAAGDLT